MISLFCFYIWVFTFQIPWLVYEVTLKVLRNRALKRPLLPFFWVGTLFGPLFLQTLRVYQWNYNTNLLYTSQMNNNCNKISGAPSKFQNYGKPTLGHFPLGAFWAPPIGQLWGCTSKITISLYCTLPVVSISRKKSLVHPQSFELEGWELVTFL